jgi:uncharacterized membrane protein YuzA (DUF378 family)
MKNLDVVSLVLLIIGGINWGLVGFFQYDAVAALGGGVDTMLSRIIYSLVGVAAVYQTFAVWSMADRWHMTTPSIAPHSGVTAFPRHAA